jgi:hypothetical protein
VGEIHQQLQQRNLCVSERTVSNLLARYDELVALHLSDHERLKPTLQAQQQVILAIDGQQPDVGHEVLWVIRDCLSGEILLARTLLSATHPDLAALFDDGRPPLDAAGLRLHERVSAIEQSLSRVEQKGGYLNPSPNCIKS